MKYKTIIKSEIFLKIIDEAINENITIFMQTNIKRTNLISIPVANNRWEMWSVPPVVGDILFLILKINTVIKSKTGIVKNKNTGAKKLYRIWLPSGFQSNRILINPKTNPINKLPESPI